MHLLKGTNQPIMEVSRCRREAADQARLIAVGVNLFENHALYAGQLGNSGGVLIDMLPAKDVAAQIDYRAAHLRLKSMITSIAQT